MILYIENHNESTNTQVLELINSAKLHSSISRHKNHLWFYILARNNLKRKFKKTISFIILSKRIKYLGMNLTKKIQYMYTNKYKTLLKEIKEDQNE